MTPVIKSMAIHGLPKSRSEQNHPPRSRIRRPDYFQLESKVLVLAREMLFLLNRPLHWKYME
jgi:hypothetical protein